MSEEVIIDLGAERNRRTQPDAEFISKDGYGRTLYTFLLSYEMDGSQYAARVWAYDFDDAQRRVESMRQSLALDGKLFTEIAE